MTTYQISARQPSGATRTFNLDCASRAEAEATVRQLGWEPDPAPPTAVGRVATSASGGAGGMDGTKLLVMAGVLGLILGVWLPAVSIFGLHVSLWDMGGFWAGACLIAGVISGVLAFMGQWQRLTHTAVAAGILLLIRFVMIWSDLDSGMGGGNSPEGQMAAAFIKAIGPSFGFGWLILFGAVAAIIVGGVKMQRREG